MSSLAAIGEVAQRDRRARLGSSRSPWR